MSVSSKMMGRQIRLPSINTIFAYKRNPLIDSPEVKAMSEQVFLYSCMTRDEYNKIEDICLFSAYFHPFTTDLPKFVNLARLMQLFFVLDDHNDCEWGSVARGTTKASEFWLQIDETLDKLLDNTKPVTSVNWPPYIAHLHFVFEEIFRDFSEDQKKRFVNTWKEYGEANVEEARLISVKHQFTSVEEYLEVRVNSTGSKCVYQMIEYADDIHLTDDEWDVLLFDYVTHGSILITLANDFQSLEKELRDSNGRVDQLFNCAAIIMIRDKCSPEEGLVKLVQIFNRYELSTKQIQSKLLERTDLREDARKFIKHAEYVMGGNFYAGFQLKRYSNVI